MAFDLFSQPVGPNISISLFGDAASQGAALGKAVPTQLTSALEGAKTGYEFALDTTAKLQQNEIRDNAIQQQPTRDAMLQAQLENEQAIAKINQSKAQLDTVDMNTKLKVASSTLDTELKQAIDTNRDVTNQQKINDLIGSSDPATQATILDDASLKGTILKSPQLADRIAGQLRNNPFVNKDALGELEGSIGYYKQELLRQSQQRADQYGKGQQAQNFDKIVANVQKDGQLQYLQGQYKLSLTDLGLVETVPSGIMTYNKDGRIDHSKPPRQSDPLGGAAKYDVLIDGKKANISLDETSNKNLYDLKNSLTARNLINAPAQSSVYGTPTPTPTPQDTTKPYLNLLGANQPAATATANPAIARNRTAELEEQAKTDPDLQKRLIAKGMIRDPAVPTPTAVATVTPSAQSPIAAPTAQPTAAASGTVTPTTAPVTQAPTQTTPTDAPPFNRPTPVPQITTASLKNVVATLPASLKRHVEVPVAYKVLNDPKLSKLTSTQKAIVAVESGGNPLAKGKGSTAEGYFQLTRDAATDVKVDKSNPEQNIAGGVKYYNRLLTKYNNAEVPALLAYNLGPGVIDSAYNLTGSYDYTDLTNGIDYLKAHGFYEKSLTDANVRHAKVYPLKVLAYKQFFNSLSYV